MTRPKGVSLELDVTNTESKFKLPFDSESIKNSLEEKWNIFQKKATDLAKDLHKQGDINTIYGAADGYNNFYGGFRIASSLTLKTDTIRISEFSDSPEGIAIILAASLGFAAFGVMGNRFKDDDKFWLKRLFAITWPYVRDAIKGGKNGGKGVQSFLSMLKYFHVETVPLNMSLIGGSVALLGLINRVWMRSMIIERKQKSALTEELVAELELLKKIRILSDEYLKLEESEEKAKIKEKIKLIGESLQKNKFHFNDDEFFEKQLKNLRLFTNFNYLQTHLDTLKQSTAFKTKSYISSAIGGLIDGLYTYLGILVICGTLAPVQFIPLLIAGSLFITLNIISRIFEDHEFQYKLDLEQKEALFIMNQEMLVSRLHDLHAVMEANAAADDDEPKTTEVKNKPKDASLALVEEQIKKLHEVAAALHNLRQTPRWKSGLAGMKYGLALTSVLVNLLTTTSFFVGLAGGVLPFPLVMATIALALVLIVLCVAIMLKLHQPFHENRTEIKQPKLFENKIKGKDPRNGTRLYVKNFSEVIDTYIKEKVDNFSFEPAPEFSQAKNGFEVFRQAVNGLPKGIKTEGYGTHHELLPADFKFNSDCDSDSPVIKILRIAGGLISGISYAVILSTRSLTQSFGKNAPKKSLVSEKSMFAQKSEVKAKPVVSEAITVTHVSSQPA